PAPTRPQLLWGRFRRRPVGVLSAVLCIVVLLFAAFGPWLAPQDPFKTSIRERLHPPSIEHALGTDELGRDLASRIIFGAQSTLSVGLMAVAFACVVGTVLVILAAMSRVWISTMIMRATDLMLAFPWFLLILTIVSVLGPGLENVILALSVAMVPHYIRLARGLALSVREREFVQAAVLIGESPFSVQTRYILPNCASPLLVQVTLDIPITIMAAAALGFLGLGAQPPMPEWGAMLSGAREYMLTDPHVVVAPALALVLVTLAFNLLGDTMRDVLDPRTEDVVR
ncbi:MAG: ABC transporter permease, partial [Rhodospirillaceae bacterium]|nr:ABC transporter permease [Rhodospirillaceae bacterium]